MKNAKDLYFPVEKVEMSEYGFNSISSAEYGIVAFLNGSDKPTLLNTCSDRYELIRNDQIFPEIERILKNSKVKYETSYRMEEYSRFVVEFRLTNDHFSVQSGKDVVLPVIRVTHSYNGLYKYSINFGYFRLICENGMTIPVPGQDNLSIAGKHTSQILDSFKQLNEKLEMFLTIKDLAKDNMKKMSDTWIKDWHNRMLEVMTVASINDKETNTDAIELSVLKEINRLQTDDKVNEWMLYNAINEGYIFNNEINKIHEAKRYDLDSKVLLYMTQS